MDSYIRYAGYLRDLARLNRQPELIERSMRDWANPMNAYSDTKFRNKFRFGKETVLHVLLPMVKDSLESYSGKYLSPLIQIMMALRFFASNSFQNILGDTVTISQPSVCGIVAKVARAFAAHRASFVKFPNAQEMDNVKHGFAQIAGFQGVIGAIDCTHVEIVRPSTDQSEIYRNRKGKFSINVQAICNPNLRFTNVVARWAGSVHDNRIFENSRIMVNIRDGAAPGGHLLGDGGYTCQPYLLTPFRKPRTDPQKRYNVAQIKTRNPIERAFGLLKRRFYCLGSKLRTDLKNTLPIIVCCFVLHNIAIIYRDEWNIDREEQGEHEEENEPIGQINIRGERYRNDFVQAYFNE